MATKAKPGNCTTANTVVLFVLCRKYVPWVQYSTLNVTCGHKGEDRYTALHQPMVHVHHSAPCSFTTGHPLYVVVAEALT